MRIIVSGHGVLYSKFVRIIKNHDIFFYYLSLILFLELVYKIAVGNGFFDIGLLYIPLYSLSFAAILAFLSGLLKTNANKIFTWTFSGVLYVWFAFQYAFSSLMNAPFSFFSLGLFSQALDFKSNISAAFFGSLPLFIIMLAPLVALFLTRKRISFKAISKKDKIVYPSVFAGAFIMVLFIMLPFQNSMYSSYKIYTRPDSQMEANTIFGLLTGTRLDIKNLFWWHDDSIIHVSTNPDPTKNPDKETGQQLEEHAPKEKKYNKTDIDFDALINSTTDKKIREMHEYFKAQQPTEQNEYTGIWKNKNLIFIVAEGFNQIAVQKDITPTLYKLANESFVFENFYTPHMYSTIGGEMQAMLGLFPTQENINYWHQKQPFFPYAIGNAFAKEGYTAKAYHNWTYTYYNREKTRPTIGFSDYLGKGNGLEKLMNCGTWPTSDLDLINGISDQIIIPGQKNVTYILTVSGHMLYTWNDNYISYKNKKLVENLPYSENIKGYLASQIELDKALEQLIKNLTEKNELENTVIAVVGDHYPYCLSLDEINELSDYKRDKTEVHRSSFILWNSKMPKTVITKTAQQIDTLPTILNLFGIEYDSRLIIGSDILSEKEGLAVFSWSSWITDKGRYQGGSFKPNEGAEIPQDYVKKINSIVSNKLTMSRLIMEKDYYNILLNR